MACKENVCVYATTNKILYELQPAADIQFKLSDGVLTGHKWFLSARLPYFERMFESGMLETTTGEVKIYDYNRSTYDAFLRYIYYGEAPPQLEEQGANETMWEIALRYDVPELHKLCVDGLIRTVDGQEAVGAWLEKAEAVYQIFERRADSVPETWSKEAKAELHRRVKGKFREKLGAMMEEALKILEDEEDPAAQERLRSSRYPHEISRLTSASIFEHTDHLMSTVLIACDINAWMKDLLLPMCQVWINRFQDQDAEFTMTTSLAAVNERVNLSSAYEACRRRFEADPNLVLTEFQGVIAEPDLEETE